MNGRLLQVRTHMFLGLHVGDSLIVATRSGCPRLFGLGVEEPSHFTVYAGRAVATQIGRDVLSVDYPICAKSNPPCVGALATLADVTTETTTSGRATATSPNRPPVLVRGHEVAEVGVPIGTLVPAALVATTTEVSGSIRLGLTDQGGAGPTHGHDYPVISRDGGASWRIAGPDLSTAQLLATVTAIGAGLGSVYLWGSQTVLVTSDLGRHWWQANFVGLTLSVRSTARGLVLRDRDVDTPPWTYLSTDAGRTWRLVV